MSFMLSSIYDSLINTGIIEIIPEIENKPTDFTIVLLKNNIAEEKEIVKFYTINLADKYIRNEINKINLKEVSFFIY